jgi:MFS family permease
VVQVTRAGVGLAVVCAAHFLIGADGLAVATALPDLQRSLGVASIDAQWVLSVYGLAFGSCLLLGGRLGDLFGQRRVLVVGVAAFAAGSVLAGVAPGLVPLTMARLVQGLGAAVAVPTSLALIAGMHPAGPQRVRALSSLASAAILGIMGGLVVGGVITDQFGWRWVFLLLALPAIVAAAVAPHVLPDPAPPDTPAPRRLDLTGAALVCGGLALVLVGVTVLERDGLGLVVAGGLCTVGVALLVAFAWWERRAVAPLLRLGLLRVPNLRAASCGIGVNAMAATAVVYVGSLYLQTGLGYSALGSAAAIAPMNVTGFLVTLVGSRVAHLSPRLILGTCFAATGAALLWLARAPAPAAYVVDVLPALVVLGASLTLVFIVTTNQAVADVPPAEKGAASGLFETSNHLLGGALGVAIYASLVSGFGRDHHDVQGYRAAFTAAAVLVVGLGLASLTQSGRASILAPDRRREA